MARVKYVAEEIDPTHKIIEGIRSTLASSHLNQARTTIEAVDKIDLDDESGASSIDLKIAYICKMLNCTHERVGTEIIFKQCLQERR